MVEHNGNNINEVNHNQYNDDADSNFVDESFGLPQKSNVNILDGMDGWIDTDGVFMVILILIFVCCCGIMTGGALGFLFGMIIKSYQ